MVGGAAASSGKGCCAEWDMGGLVVLVVVCGGRAIDRGRHDVGVHFNSEENEAPSTLGPLGV